MHVILAENIGPGLFWILVFFGGMGCTVLALIAILPAALGRFRAAMFMAAPALAFALFAALLVVYFFYFAPDRPVGAPEDATEDARSFRQVLTFLSGLPLAVSLFAMLLALVCRRLWKRPAA